MQGDCGIWTEDEQSCHPEFQLWLSDCTERQRQENLTGGNCNCPCKKQNESGLTQWCEDKKELNTFIEDMSDGESTAGEQR